MAKAGRRLSARRRRAKGSGPRPDRGGYALAATFALVAVVAANLVAVQFIGGSVPVPPALVRDVTAGPDDRFALQFVGDTLLGDDAQPWLDFHGYDWPFEKVRPALDGDFTIAGAEAPITAYTQQANPIDENFYRTRPEAAAAIARAGIDALTLANNQILDAGTVGLADTMAHAQTAGMAAIGAGPDLARAEQPLLLRTEVGTIAVVGIGEDFGPDAESGTPGTLVLSPETIRRAADTARAHGARWVVAAVHWGDDYGPVNAEQRYWAQQFADAGYDLVVGAGPHNAQPIEVIGTMPVVFSLGNFVLGTGGRFTELGMPAFGLIANLELDDQGTARLTVRCLQTNNDVVGFQPRPCDQRQSQIVLPALYPGLTMAGRVGVIDCTACFAPEVAR